MDKIGYPFVTELRIVLRSQVPECVYSVLEERLWDPFLTFWERGGVNNHMCLKQGPGVWLPGLELLLQYPPWAVQLQLIDQPLWIPKWHGMIPHSQNWGRGEIIPLKHNIQQNRKNLVHFTTHYEELVYLMSGILIIFFFSFYDETSFFNIT